METLFKAIWGVAIVVLSPVWHGYVLSIVWGWYVAPTFNTAHLSVPVAIGISAVVRYLTWQETQSKSEEKLTVERLAALTGRAVGLPALTLLFCWIVKFWM